MEEIIEVETLESEVKKFVDKLPFWEKYIADKILTGTAISDKELDTAYSYLLEELKLNHETVKPKLTINYKPRNTGNYKLDLLFTKLENVEGVNALLENQTIDFSPNITIIYGSTGSGKSGYVRLMKKVFYSKTPEEIIQNIHLANGHKPINAKFTFQSAGKDISLMYPANSANAEFEQYAVFDGKSVLRHLDQRNEFEFLPAALSFFAELTEVIKRIEEKLNFEIMIKNSANEFAELFEGESEIKILIQNLSAITNIADLKKHTPFSEKDIEDKKVFEKQYDELLLASKSKEKEIKTLENIKLLIDNNKKNIEAYNAYFTTKHLTYVKSSITDCLSKEANAKAEGIEKFKTNKIQNIGTVEWKNFIEAAEQFALQQKKVSVYPENGDNCLLCQQPLSVDAQKLIKNYWTFIKSVAEQDAKNAQARLDQIKAGFDKLSFDLYPDENTLTVWLTEKYPQVLFSLKQTLANQKTLAANILSGLSIKIANKWTEIKISVDDHDTIIKAIDASIKLLRENEQSAELDKLMNAKTKLSHKEKLNTHYAKFETYISNQQWILKAQGISWMAEKRKITDWDKYLSGKYFNQKYIDTFKKECEELKGDFGISISHTGTAGASFRQLFIGQRNPSSILSEGEQKVIALADFLSEMQLSEVNRGIIFDDPVTSLDESRKKDIALRLVREGTNKQVIIFTHDLIFVSNLITFCEESKIPFFCHWIENNDGKPGQVWLRNSPSYEKEYRNAEPAKKLYTDSKKEDCPPARREFLVKSGFAALRTCYEVLVINDLFKNVVQRYNERVSIESLKDVYFDEAIINDLKDSFDQCCRYMEGHTHSDKYAYKKPEPENLNGEIQRYEAIRTKIKKTKKPSP